MNQNGYMNHYNRGFLMKMKHNYFPYLIIILGAALRIADWLLGDAFWYDEAFTAWLAGLSLPTMMQAIAGDVHPPLWYLIEWATIRLIGNSEMALRLPACIIGLASLPLAWAVARQLAPRPVALVALAIFALSPFQIYYSQEARMYGLLQAAVLAATWATLTKRWAILAVFSLLGLLTHNLMVIYLVVIWGLGLWRDWRAGTWGATIAQVVAVICYLPWAAWLLLPQISGVRNGFWVQPVTPGGFFYPVYVLFFHIAAPPWLQLHAGILAVTLVLWGSVKVWRDHRVIIVLAWGPLALLALISVAWRPIYLHRTLIGAALPLYLLAAFAIVNVARSFHWPTMMILAALVVPVGNYYIAPEARRWDVRPHAAVIACQPGDVVYHVNLASLILFRYYLPGCEHWVWPAANDLSQSLTPQTKIAMGMQQAALDDIPWRRAWLVWAESPVMNESEPGAVGEILLKHNYRLVHQVEPTDLVTLRIWEVIR
jgi:mannosyltransferase